MVPRERRMALCPRVRQSVRGIFLIYFFVGSDIDQKHFRTVLIKKIKDKSLFVCDPDRPEALEYSAQRVGFKGGVKGILLKQGNLPGKLNLQFRVLPAPLPVCLLKPVIPKEINH